MNLVITRRADGFHVASRHFDIGQWATIETPLAGPFTEPDAERHARQMLAAAQTPTPTPTPKPAARQKKRPSNTVQQRALARMMRGGES